MITIKLTNKTAYTLILILALLTTTLVVYAANPATKPNPGHYSQDIMVNVGGQDLTLQDAIDQNKLGAIITPGTWCGFKIAANTNPEFTCNGYNPQVSCPVGYTSKMFANMGATYGGNWYTCIKN